MSVSNGKIVAPVSIDDVKSVLGESSNDLATLCKSENIKMWSKNKPIKHNCLFKPTDAQKKEVNYGISNIPYYRLLGKMSQDVINGSMQNATNISTLDTRIEPWHYQKPIGGYTSPYRLGDFDGYFANAASTVSYTFRFCILAVSIMVRASQICCPPVSLRSTTACFCFRLNLRS